MNIIPNWHPLLVHFTIALYLISVLFFIVGYSIVKPSWKEKLTTAAYLNLWLGALITLLTVGAGFYAYNTVGHDTPSHLAMTDHRNWAIATAVFFWVLSIWSIFTFRASKPVGLLFVLAMVIGAGALSITGLKGGEIVYRYGLGVMSLPQVEGEGHSSHSHDGGVESAHPAPLAPTSHEESEEAPHTHGEEDAHANEEPNIKIETKANDGHDHSH